MWGLKCPPAPYRAISTSSLVPHPTCGRLAQPSGPDDACGPAPVPNPPRAPRGASRPHARRSQCRRAQKVAAAPTAPRPAGHSAPPPCRRCGSRPASRPGPRSSAVPTLLPGSGWVVGEWGGMAGRGGRRGGRHRGHQPVALFGREHIVHLRVRGVGWGRDGRGGVEGTPQMHRSLAGMGRPRGGAASPGGRRRGRPRPHPATACPCSPRGWRKAPALQS